MSEFEAQDGIAFLLIYFKHLDRYMYLPFAELKRFWDRMRDGGPKSFKFDELEPSWEISPFEGTFLHYLEQIQMDLERRDG